MKFSSVKKFKAITGHDFLQLTDKIDSKNKNIDDIELLALGLYLARTEDTSNGRKRFNRMMEDEDLRYEVTDNINFDLELTNVMHNLENVDLDDVRLTKRLADELVTDLQGYDDEVPGYVFTRLDVFAKAIANLEKHVEELKD